MVAGRIQKILLTLGAFITHFLVSLRFYGIIGAAVHPLSLIPVVIAGLTMGLRVGLLFSLLGASLNVLIIILGSSYAASVPDWKLLTTGIFVQVVVGIAVGRMHDLGVLVKEQILVLQSTQHLLEENMNERKNMEDQLSRQRVFLEDIIDSLYNGVAAVDAAGKQIVVNKALCEMTGFQKEELLGATPPFKYWSEERLDDIFSAFNQVLEGVPRNVTLTFKRKNGERFLAFVSAMRLVTPDGNAFFIATVTDVTSRVQMEEALRDSEEKYRTLFEESNDALLIADASTGYVLDANEAAERLFGYTRKEIIGMHQTQFHPSENASYHQNVFREHVQRGGITDYEVNIIRKDGSITPVSIGAKVMRLHGKEVIYGIFRDISERKQMEAEKMNIMGKVTGGIAHDIRNPLSAIRTAAYLLKAATGKRRRELLGIIDRNIVYVDRIMQGLLDFSSPHPLVFVEDNVNLVLQETLSNIAIPENVNLVTEFDDISPVNLDRVMLGRVFTNLIMNAIQSMPEGGELISSTRHVDNLVEIKISDTGEGISKKNLAKIFTPFFTTKAKGTGLGLVNAKNTVEQHGGIITVESQKGHGTTVTILLPVSRLGELKS